MRARRFRTTCQFSLEISWLSQLTIHTWIGRHKISSLQAPVYVIVIPHLIQQPTPTANRDCVPGNLPQCVFNLPGCIFYVMTGSDASCSQRSVCVQVIEQVNRPLEEI